MKNELKKLYSKDKKLALEVAKVLGYRIKVKALGPDLFETFEELAKLVKGMTINPSILKETEELMDKFSKENHKKALVLEKKLGEVYGLLYAFSSKYFG